MAYKQESITPYGNGEEKSKQVEAMFDNIAHSYDTLNHRLSFGIDYLWRKTAIKQLKPFIQSELKKIVDEGMMHIGESKVKAAGLSEVISFKKEDCEHMSYADNSFDAITTAFGIRNFQNLDACLKEMCRVLRKGGQLSILELSRPMRFPMKQLFWIYSHTLLPLYGKLVSRDSEAYTYLISTIESFPQGEEMVGIFKKAGFSEAKFKRLTFGICTCYFAIK